MTLTLLPDWGGWGGNSPSLPGVPTIADVAVYRKRNQVFTIRQQKNPRPFAVGGFLVGRSGNCVLAEVFLGRLIQHFIQGGNKARAIALIFSLR